MTAENKGRDWFDSHLPLRVPGLANYFDPEGADILCNRREVGEGDIERGGTFILV